MRRKVSFLAFLCLFFLVSCARLPVPQRTVPPLPKVPRETGISVPSQELRKNVMHTVAPGETVWRLAKMYDVAIEDIVRANTLSSSCSLTMGQRLIIPDAAPIKAVISLYPSSKWQYIIVHHSATEEGNSLSFHKSHLSRGFDRGVGYHFVIDNDTGGKQDGQIEVTPRWIKQEDGAHCKASQMNTRAIGICLVGNFNQAFVTKAQMDSLVYLIHRLKTYYKIPLKNILGHGQVPGARTDCPGTHFPWVELMRRLRAESGIFSGNLRYQTEEVHLTESKYSLLHR